MMFIATFVGISFLKENYNKATDQSNRYKQKFLVSFCKYTYLERISIDVVIIQKTQINQSSALN